MKALRPASFALDSDDTGRRGLASSVDISFATP
jgi:hypothetical protein